MGRSCLLFYILCLTLAFDVLSIEVTDPTYDANCHVDITLHPEEDDNYIDCNSPEMVAAKKTRCCDVEASKGCCTEETKGGKMVAIGTSIATVTVAIMTACFIVFWCNSSTFPCLKKYEQKCPCLKVKEDEFTKLYEKPPEIIQTTEFGTANVNRAFVRNQDRDEFAPTEKYETPDELKGKVKDDWWE